MTITAWISLCCPLESMWYTSPRCPLDTSDPIRTVSAIMPKSTLVSPLYYTLYYNQVNQVSNELMGHTHRGILALRVCINSGGTTLQTLSFAQHARRMIHWWYHYYRLLALPAWRDRVSPWHSYMPVSVSTCLYLSVSHNVSVGICRYLSVYVGICRYLMYLGQKRFLYVLLTQNIHDGTGR